jgi:hypothetical protein
LSFETVDGAFAGTLVGSTAVLFPVNLDTPVAELRYITPAETSCHLITRLTPGGGYDVISAPIEGGIEITVTAGSSYRADVGGVLLIGALPEVLGGASLAFTNQAAAVTPAAIQAPVTDQPAQSATESPGSVAETPIPGDQPAEGGPAATGQGRVVYKAFDEESQSWHLYSIEASEGASPVDVSRALDAIGSAALDEWIGISPDGEWLLIGKERFDAECAGWSCMAVVDAGLTGEVVHIGAAVLHPEGFGAIGPGGELIVNRRRRRPARPRPLGDHPTGGRLERAAPTHRRITVRLQPHRRDRVRRRHGRFRLRRPAVWRGGHGNPRSRHRRLRFPGRGDAG